VPLRVIETWRGLEAGDKGAAVAIGAFDGVHRGHQTVIAGAAAAARATGAPLGVVTFDPHPRRWFAPDAPSFRLMTPAQQNRALDDLGVDLLYRLAFDAEMVSMSAEDFVRRVLVDGLAVRHVSVGPDFTYGKGRSGTVEQLAAYGRQFGFGVTVAPLLFDEGEKCASTAVRAALKAGKPERAARLLGRPYAIEGVVVHGDHLGRKIGFPTANVSLEDYIRLEHGIYAARTRLADGREIPGVAYIGNRPTVNGADERLEVNLFDFDEDLYGQTLETDLVAFIRGDVKFDGLDALTAQIARDCAAARQILLGE
jgi:riboflavin kinase/FMN adenylyltransferase